MYKYWQRCVLTLNLSYLHIQGYSHVAHGERVHVNLHIMVVFPSPFRILLFFSSKKAETIQTLA